MIPKFCPICNEKDTLYEVGEHLYCNECGWNSE